MSCAAVKIICPKVTFLFKGHHPVCVVFLKSNNYIIVYLNLMIYFINSDEEEANNNNSI